MNTEWIVVKSPDELPDDVISITMVGDDKQRFISPSTNKKYVVEYIDMEWLNKILNRKPK